MSCVPEILTAYVEEKAVLLVMLENFGVKWSEFVPYFGSWRTRVIFRLQNLFKGMSLMII